MLGIRLELSGGPGLEYQHTLVLGKVPWDSWCCMLVSWMYTACTQQTLDLDLPCGYGMNCIVMIEWPHSYILYCCQHVEFV